MGILLAHIAAIFYPTGKECFGNQLALGALAVLLQCLTFFVFRSVSKPESFSSTVSENMPLNDR